MINAASGGGGVRHEVDHIIWEETRRSDLLLVEESLMATSLVTIVVAWLAPLEFLRKRVPGLMLSSCQIPRHFFLVSKIDLRGTETGLTFRSLRGNPVLLPGSMPGGPHQWRRS